jgi:hypothetical protein
MKQYLIDGPTSLDALARYNILAAEWYGLKAPESPVADKISTCLRGYLGLANLLRVQHTTMTPGNTNQTPTNDTTMIGIVSRRNELLTSLSLVSNELRTGRGLD